MEAGTASRGAAPAVAAWLRSPLVPIAALVAGAGLLRLWALGGAHPNPYYDAAVRSMGMSVHNFLLAAYEPGGSVAIDKPPLDLWLQVASVKLLGFGPRGLIAPQALASTAAVGLLYGFVRRGFGRVAGLSAAAALAVLPISVVTARSDTMDSLAMALSVAAAWLTVRAAQTGRLRWLVAAGAVCGLNFEVKLFESLLVVPALAILYWLAAPCSRARRARDLSAAGVALAVLALAWPLAVSAVPRSERPYPLGSTDGSVWSSIVGFNGVQRLQGPRHGTPSAATAKSAARAPGPDRLFRGGSWDLRTLVGVELLSALVLGGVCLAARPWGRAPPGDPPRLRLAIGAALALWLLPAVLVFSTVQGLHPRYLEAMAPAVAGVLGVGIAGLARLGGRGLAIRAAAAAWVLVATAYLARAAHGPAVAVTWAAAAALCVALVAARRRGRGFVPAAACLAAVALLAVPLARSTHLIDINSSTAGQLGTTPPAQTAALARYLGPRTRGARWELATSSYLQAPAIVVHDSRPVMILAGVNRHEQVSQTQVRDAVRRGELRYALVGGACGRARRIQTKRHCQPAVRWVRLHGADVTHAAGLPGRGLLFRLRSATLHTTRSQHGRRLG